MTRVPSPPSILFCRSNPIAPDPRVEKEARSLVRAGYRVSVIAWDRSGDLPSLEERDGFTIQRIRLRSGYAAGIMNLPNLMRWEFALNCWLARHHTEYDIIHACDFDTVLPALQARRRWGKKVVYDIFDFYADHLRRTPGWLKKLIRRNDLRAIGQADAVILCDDARKEQILGSQPRNITVIYNSPEDSGTHPPASRPSQPGSFQLAYIGLLQVERGLLDVLEVMHRHPDWHLDLAGFGGDQEHILEQACRMPNVVWHGRVPYERAIELSLAADVLFALYDPAIENHRYSSPNKVFESLMLSKPVVVAEGTNMDRIITAAGCGLIVPYGDIAALDAAFTRLASNPAKRLELGSRGRLAYETSYSWTIMEQRLVSLYQNLIPQ